MATSTDSLEEEFEDDDDLYGMFCWDHRKSKLKYDLLLDHYGKEKSDNDPPRLYVVLSADFRDLVPVSIDRDNPKILTNRKISDFESVAAWIKENYLILIHHWNQIISDYDVINLIPYEERPEFIELVIKEDGEEEAKTFFKNIEEEKRLTRLKFQKMLNDESEVDNHVSKVD